MEKQEIKNIMDKCDMEGDDWILAELEPGLIVLQRKSNKAKFRVTNLQQR